jgi:membrane-bound ClpP family serine protease
MSYSLALVAGLQILVGLTVFRRSAVRGLAWMVLGALLLVPSFDPALRSAEWFREGFVLVLGLTLAGAGLEAFFVLRANRLRRESESERLAKRVSGLR